MIERITRSLRDEESLARAARGVHPLQPKSYRGRVVLKPWGHEFLLFQNEHVAVWLLHIGRKHSTSMHCHPSKLTSLVMLSGRALVNTFHRRCYLDAPGGIMIDPGVFHSTKCLAGLYLLEIETPPEKTDLVRLSDQYQRQGAGYEAMSEMREAGLERYGHFFLEEPASGAVTTAKFQGLEIRIGHFREPKEFQSDRLFRGEIISSVLRGTLLNLSGSERVRAGELFKPSEMIELCGGALTSDGPTTILSLMAA